MYYHDQNYAGAERAYRAALRLDPAYALAHFNLGNVLDETGRLPEAIAEYLEAVRLAPHYADAHYNLALAGAPCRTGASTSGLSVKAPGRRMRARSSSSPSRKTG